MQWKNEGGAEILFSHGSPNSCGTAILISNNTNYKLLSTIPDPLGRFIILKKIQISEKVYVIVNIYAPNKDKDPIQFFRKLHVLFQSENLDSEENIILGGDLNCPLNSVLDKHGGIMIPRRATIDSIESLQTELDLVDMWRVKNPQKRSYTWSTDHAAITLALGEIGEMKGPGIWKMNVSLLDDENCLNQLTINIPKWKLEGV